MEDVVIKILPDFTIWKLHSFKEILIFFLVLATGLVVFRWKWLQMKKARTPEMAMKRVKKAIREGSHKKTYFFVPPKGSLTGVDLIALLPGKALLLRVIHKGYRIYGHNQDSTWRVTDNASSLIVKNPVRALEESEAVFKETLAKEGAHHVKVETIAVFADNYAEPSFFYGGRRPPPLGIDADAEKRSPEDCEGRKDTGIGRTQECLSETLCTCR